MKILSIIVLTALLASIGIAMSIANGPVEKTFVVSIDHTVKNKDLEKEAKKIGKLLKKGKRVATIVAYVEDVKKADDGVIVEELKVYNKSISGCTPLPEPPPTDEPQIVDWGNERLKSVEAQKINNGSSVKVCVLDTGINKNHPDLKYLRGENFSSNSSSDFEDRDGHGSHTAGLVAAINNTYGVVGSSQAQLIIGKVLDDNGSGFNSWIAEGIYYCVEQKANIISMSLGGPHSYVIENAVNYATINGVEIFAAAGNSSSNDVGYPAAFDNVYSISATDKNDTLAYFSSYGKVEYACPGLDILSTVPGGYKTMSGTSMATPLCAGIAALYMAQGKPRIAEYMGSENKFGMGILSAKGLLK
jgi:subtilisin family serine protease